MQPIYKFSIIMVELLFVPVTVRLFKKAALYM